MEVGDWGSNWDVGLIGAVSIVKYSYYGSDLFYPKSTAHFIYIMPCPLLHISTRNNRLLT